MCTTSCIKSCRSVQQMHPLLNLAKPVPSGLSTSEGRAWAASILTAAMSFTRTPTRLACRLVRMWFNKVVSPAPRNPDSTVTGTRRAELSPVAPRLMLPPGATAPTPGQSVLGTEPMRSRTPAGSRSRRIWATHPPVAAIALTLRMAPSNCLASGSERAASDSSVRTLSPRKWMRSAPGWLMPSSRAHSSPSESSISIKTMTTSWLELSPAPPPPLPLPLPLLPQPATSLLASPSLASWP